MSNQLRMFRGWEEKDKEREDGRRKTILMKVN